MGDPALILTPPVEQFREDYVFLVPSAYAENYLNIMAPSETTVTLDGEPVAAEFWTTIPATTYQAAKVPVDAGVHTLVADTPVGLTVYGYDDDVSYGYTAGLNLVDL